MCGLAGFVRAEKAPGGDVAGKVFKRLWLAMDSRGGHAAGLCTLRNGTREIWKEAVTAREALQTPNFTKFWNASVTAKTTVVLGHTRYASHGARTDPKNAHPFSYGRVTGAHNGIISNYRSNKVLEAYPEAAGNPVDSMVLFQALDSTPSVEDALAVMNGYWALSWVKGRSLFLCRTTDAVLSACYVPDLRTLFWASTPDALKAALGAEKIDVRDLTMFSLAPNTLYEYNPAAFDAEGTNAQKTPLTFHGKTTDVSGRVNTAKPTWDTAWDNDALVPRSEVRRVPLQALPEQPELFPAGAPSMASLERTVARLQSDLRETALQVQRLQRQVEALDMELAQREAENDLTV